jgi:hypothetical protein
MKINKSSGQASRLLLVLAAIVLVAVIIVYLVMKMATPAPKPPINPPDGGNTPPLPVYEQTLGNIRFIHLSAIDHGDTLFASNIRNSLYISSSQKDLYTTEKFVQVTIGAQNMGTENIEQGAWDIENIVDSQGRNFVPEQSYNINPWLPNPNPCGTLLKPAFEPTPCTKIYEVAKGSTGLKIRIQTGKDNTANNFSSGKRDEFLLDLIVR